MSADTRHPDYSRRFPDWNQLRDTYEGQRAIKSKREIYLPATASMIEDNLATDQLGWLMYNAYITRAVFPDFVKQAVDNMVGIMHREPAVIELPDLMEPLREMATIRGESLLTLLRKVNLNQLRQGRYGLLVDVADGQGPGTLPFLVGYEAENIINWDDGRREDGRQHLDFVVLDESNDRREEVFTWDIEIRHRVLSLGPLTDKPDDTGAYMVTVLEDGDTSIPTVETMVVPSIGGKSLDFLPFVFINTKDLSPETDTVPLLGLSNLALTVYRGEADYRQSLFMQGQDTLVVINGGEDPERRAGAGASIELPKGGDAKYIGVSSQGLPEMRMALENDKTQGNTMSVSLIDVGKTAESGEALRIRVSAKTATLVDIAKTGANGLQEALRHMGKWMGLADAAIEDIKVSPNLDFADDSMTGQDLMALMQAKALGAPISMKSIHRSMRRRDMTDMSFDDEELEMGQEEPLPPGPGVP